MAFQAYGDLVQVERIQEDNSKHKTTSGVEVVIPEKFRQQSDIGTVISVGHKVHGPILPGDIVKFGAYNAENLSVDGKEYLLIREGDIRGVHRAE